MDDDSNLSTPRRVKSDGEDDDKLATMAISDDYDEVEIWPDIKCHFIRGLGSVHLRIMMLDMNERSIGFLFSIVKSLTCANSCNESKLMNGEGVLGEEHLYATCLEHPEAQNAINGESPAIYIYIHITPISRTLLIGEDAIVL